jgi:hypothetical protein
MMATASYYWSRAPLKLGRNVEMPSPHDSGFAIDMPIRLWRKFSGR